MKKIILSNQRKKYLKILSLYPFEKTLLTLYLFSLTIKYIAIFSFLGKISAREAYVWKKLNMHELCIRKLTFNSNVQSIAT